MGNVSGIVALLFGMIALMQCFKMIPAGHVGVVDFFGVVSETTLKSGVNLVNPLARVIKFSVQTSEEKETMQVLSQEGLTIGLEISALYRLNADSAASIYKKVSGADYLNVLPVPQFRSISRAVTASFQASSPMQLSRTARGAGKSADAVHPNEGEAGSRAKTH